MRKRRRTCTTIYLGSNDKRFEYVTDGNVKLADSVTIERWVVPVSYTHLTLPTSFTV